MRGFAAVKHAVIAGDEAEAGVLEGRLGCGLRERG